MRALTFVAIAAIAGAAVRYRVRLERTRKALATAREALAEHEIFKAIVVKGTAGVGVFAGPDGARSLVYANAVLIQQLNYRGDPLGKTTLELVGPELTRGLVAKLRGELSGGNRNGIDIFPWASDDGERWFEIDAYLVDGRDGASYLVAVTTDVTAIRDAEIASSRASLAEETNLALEREIVERKTAEQRLAHAAYHDALTGLPNRLLFSERLDLVLRRVGRIADRSVAVLFVDLDGFKLVNDRFGHTFADLLLVAVARRFETALRADDTIARLGGDEFVVLLENVTPEAALQIANVLLDEISKPFDLGDEQVLMSASIGVALGSGEDATADELVRDADIAMYRAKTLGKRRCELFVSEMGLRTQRRTHLGLDLRHALARGEFEVYYQPIVSLARAGALSGFEALVRWQHPTLGLVGPTDFIALAEETGAIVELGAWVLRTACDQAERWRAHTPGGSHLAINVNVSAYQLVTPGFQDIVAAVLRETGLPPSALHLEITESAVVHEPIRVASELLSLRETGVSIAMDDFGTGYASLAYLKAFPIDSLKIDRSFISERGASIGDPEIVRSLIVLANRLGLAVVAEGVETPEQEAQLRELGCSKAQGYLFARPLTTADATRFIERGSPVAV
ncbi:MAG: hypothetical protein NVSMB21_06610 [Vulcanimicrobiaceae bacterium]